MEPYNHLLRIFLISLPDQHQPKNERDKEMERQEKKVRDEVRDSSKTETDIKILTIQ